MKSTTRLDSNWPPSKRSGRAWSPRGRKLKRRARRLAKRRAPTVGHRYPRGHRRRCGAWIIDEWHELMWNVCVWGGGRRNTRFWDECSNWLKRIANSAQNEIICLWRGSEERVTADCNKYKTNMNECEWMVYEWMNCLYWLQCTILKCPIQQQEMKKFTGLIFVSPILNISKHIFSPLFYSLLQKQWQ